MLALTTTEAAALTGLDERAVRKDVEHGILDAGTPPRFAEVALVYLRACASFAFHLDARDRKRLYADIADALERGLARVDLGPGWTLDVAAVASGLRRRVADFEAWRAALSPAAKTRGDPALCAGSPSVWVRIAADRHRGWRDSRGAAVGVGDRARGNQGRGGRICRSARRIFRRRWAAPAISLAR
ncbi:MAG: hypothetical protein L6Q80_10285 [Dehalococcoidia bacterium]|nr:hypothetical protein [Dehalococcoidia bacterium]